MEPTNNIRKINSLEELTTRIKSYHQSRCYEVIISKDQKLIAKENDRYFVARILAGLALSVLSLGIAPLVSKDVRALFERKVKTFHIGKAVRDLKEKLEGGMRTSAAAQLKRDANLPAQHPDRLEKGHRALLTDMANNPTQLLTDLKRTHNFIFGQEAHNTSLYRKLPPSLLYGFVYEQLSLYIRSENPDLHVESTGLCTF